MNITTRKFPRTLNEAFLCDAQSASAIEHHRAPMPWTDVAIIVAAVFMVGLVVGEWIFK